AIALDVNGNPTLQNAVDCNGNTTYVGEIFNSRLAQNNYAGNPNGFCGVPIGTTSTGLPTNIFTGNSGTNTSIDPLGNRLAALFPVSNTSEGGGNNFLSDPKRTETENKFDTRFDYTLSDKDNSF